MTLRSLAELPDRPAPVADSTLLIIDAQQAYSAAGALPLEGVEGATAVIETLMADARAAGAPIVHVAHLGAPGSPFDPADGGRFLPGIEPVGHEPTITKRLPNSFADTALLETLSRLDGAATPRPLIIVGFMTHMCVSSTARAALDLGIATTVVSDATATRDLPSADGSAELVSAAAVHGAALAGLADRFSIVTTSQRVLAASVE